MRITGVTIQQMIRSARQTAPLGLARALHLGKLRALRSLYENSVYARFTVPGAGVQQRSLREALCIVQELRAAGKPTRKLLREIREARRVPMEFSDADGFVPPTERP